MKISSQLGKSPPIRPTHEWHSLTAFILVSYDDGSIRLWDSRTATVIISFNGHKSAITQLVFDNAGVRLASGSKDTDIIVWDLIAEVGLFKLRGHTDQITSLHFLFPSAELLTASGLGEHAGFLLTTGKDALIKVWDLASQHCIETHVAQSNGECWSLGLSPDQGGCITAGNDGELKVWSIDESGHGGNFQGKGRRGWSQNPH